LNHLQTSDKTEDNVLSFLYSFYIEE